MAGNELNDELKALLEQLDMKLGSANGYLDQVAAYNASILNELRQMHTALRQIAANQ